jgi:hypothetical protein
MRVFLQRSLQAEDSLVLAGLILMLTEKYCLFRAGRVSALIPSQEALELAALSM